MTDFGYDLASNIRPPGLLSAYLKFTRAKEHAHALHDGIIEHMKSSPYLIKAQPQRHPEGYTGIASGNAVVPPKLSLVFGDFLVNLRASLDHLAEALVIQNGGTPCYEKGKTTQFPITLQDPELPLTVHGGVSDEALTILKSLQPNRGNPWDNPLFVLNKLAIIDKHRTIHLLTHVTKVSSLRLTFSDGRPIRQITGTFDLEDNAQLGWFPGSLAPDDVEVKVSGLFVGFVTMSEVLPGQHVTGITSWLLAHVLDDVLPQFDTCFT